MIYIVDAGPLIAFLDNEPGADVVEDILTEPGSECFAHTFNLTEVFYIYFRRGGRAMAEDAVQSLIEAGVIVRDDNDARFWMDAATFKGSHAMAFQDAFCLALAVRLNGTLITSDHNEFDPILPQGIAPVIFIR